MTEKEFSFADGQEEGSFPQISSEIRIRIFFSKIQKSLAHRILVTKTGLETKTLDFYLYIFISRFVAQLVCVRVTFITSFLSEMIHTRNELMINRV